MQDTTVPKVQMWRKMPEGLRLTSKGSIDSQGGKRLHFLEAIAFNRGVVHAQDYKHMTGKYFRDFVRKNWSMLFTSCL